jgi:hypothetical protein
MKGHRGSCSQDLDFLFYPACGHFIAEEQLEAAADDMQFFLQRNEKAGGEEGRGKRLSISLREATVEAIRCRPT